MPVKRWPKRELLQLGARRGLQGSVLVCMLLMAVGGMLATEIVLRSMVTEYAASAARDAVVTAVNDNVKDVVSEPRFGGVGLVELERDD